MSDRNLLAVIIHNQPSFLLRYASRKLDVHPNFCKLAAFCWMHISFSLRVQIMFWKGDSMPGILKIERPVAGDTANINTAIGIVVGVIAVTWTQSSPVVKFCWQAADGSLKHKQKKGNCRLTV